MVGAVRESETCGLVTVIVPAYNAARFLDRTLWSIRRQTYPHLEILVIDDASDDTTADIARVHADDDPRLRLVCANSNRGVAASRNHGLEIASGRYVAFIDADDLWHPAKIERQLGIMDRHVDDPSWAGVYALCRVIDTEDRVLRDGPARALTGFILCRNLIFKPVGNGSSLLVRREAALAVGGFDQGLVAKGIGGCEDLDFELRLATHYRIDAVPEMLVGYRSYEGNMSSDTGRMLASLAAATEICFAANPQLSAAIRRFARAQVLRFEAEKLAGSRSRALRLRSLLAFLRIPLFDPAMFLYLCRRITGQAFDQWRDPASRAMDGSSRPLFSDLDPREISPRPPASFWDDRLRLLERADAALERVRFSTRPPIMANSPKLSPGE